MRDSWAKALYERLFNWLVERLNETIKPSEKEKFEYYTVGLLDIYGFEVFEINGFEQIMINYTNEKLH
jgi:myosin-5